MIIKYNSYPFEVIRIAKELPDSRTQTFFSVSTPRGIQVGYIEFESDFIVCKCPDSKGEEVYREPYCGEFDGTTPPLKNTINGRPLLSYLDDAVEKVYKYMETHNVAPTRRKSEVIIEGDNMYSIKYNCEGTATRTLVMTKEAFIKAYNAWIKEENNDD